MLRKLGFEKIAKLGPGAVGTIAGAVGGGVGTGVLYPLDTKITAQQSGTEDKLKKRIKEQGLLPAYYAGMNDKLFKNIASMAIVMGTAGAVKPKLTKLFA